MVINGLKLYDTAPVKRMEPLKVYENGVSHGMSEAGYDIRVKQAITFHRDFFLRRAVDRIVLGPDNKVLEHDRFPGRFVLASALEEFEMPNTLMGIVHDKSSWARQGLSVFNTVIEPGWRGFLTLELVYHGDKDLHIPAGSGIAQVVFHQVSNSVEYHGRYQNQRNAPVPAIESKS
jgi:dCTP deaminase